LEEGALLDKLTTWHHEFNPEAVGFVQLADDLGKRLHFLVHLPLLVDRRNHVLQLGQRLRQLLVLWIALLCTLEQLLHVDYKLEHVHSHAANG
jgi:CHASE1-domain containing sensor protein